MAQTVKDSLRTMNATVFGFTPPNDSLNLITPKNHYTTLAETIALDGRIFSSLDMKS
jgi:hypothetical protein